MKTCDEMVNSLLSRREQYAAERKKRSKKTAGVCVSLVCCAALFVSGLYFYEKNGADDPVVPENAEMPELNGILPGTTENSTAASVPAVESEGQSQLPVSDGAKESETAGNAAQVYAPASVYRKFRLHVDVELAQAMKERPEETLTVAARYVPATAEITDFFYEGKSLSEWAVLAADSQLTLEKMKELLKFGDDLKYGTALYETGTPDGIRWDERLYYDKINYYGPELLGRYIVDGEFLRAELERDIAAYDVGEAQRRYAEAFDAYADLVMPGFLRELSDAGVICTMGETGNEIILTVTVAELDALVLSDLENWWFYLR